MISSLEKIERVGGIEAYVSRGENIQFLNYHLVSRKSGVILLNENSMVDTFRIDEQDKGLVSPQSVDLESMTGSKVVLRAIRAMLDNKECTFLPGTLLRDFGGYCLPVMPIIRSGKLEMEKPKKNGFPYVDDYRKLAEIFFGKEYARNIAQFGPIPIEHMGKLHERLNREVEIRKKNSYAPLDINGLCVSPIICNDLAMFSQDYDGRPIDILCHSACELFDNDKMMLSYYCRILERLESRGKLSLPLVLALAEQRQEERFEGLFFYKNGKLEQLNLKKSLSR